MSRNELYPAVTRATQENHLYVPMGGIGDLDDLIKPDTVTPPTATDMLTAILSRDGSDRSAHTEIRESARPDLRLGHAAGAYEHAILTGIDHLVGDEKLAELTAAAEHTIPGITHSPAWDILRSHLGVLHLKSEDPIAVLTDARDERELGTARDLAAVLDWRIDPTGNHSLDEGPLPWLPAIFPGLSDDPGYGPYLHARSDLTATLADDVNRQAAEWTPATAPSWATPYLGRPQLLADLALWRAAHRVPDNDDTPAGPPPHRIAHRRLHNELVTRVTAAAGAADDSAYRWSHTLDPDLAQRLRTDPYWPVLASRLSAAERAGAPVAALLAAVTAHQTLPSETTAAALWWRLSPHLGAIATTITSHVLLPDWTTILTTTLGDDTTTVITDDRLWPSIVVHVDAAERRGLNPQQLVTDAAEILASETGHLAPHQLAIGLLTHLAVLSDPDPIHDETAPPDPADHDLEPPADLHTATTPTNTGPSDESGPGVPLPDQAPDDPELLPPDPASDNDSHPGDTDTTETDRLYQAVAAAHAYYLDQAPETWVPAYLTDRGIPAPDAGRAPAGWTKLVDHLRAAGYTDTELKAAGLARTSSRGTLIDAFRDRLTLPIHDTTGRIVAFTARANPTTINDHTPKYLNSPTTDIYNKTELLYGLTTANIAALRAGAQLAIAEGPLDADAIIAATDHHTIGLASLGTALTPDQIHTLTQIAPEITDQPITLAFDTDNAGHAAALRGYHAIADATGRTDTQTWQPGNYGQQRKDPAEILQHDGPETLAATLADTNPAADLVVDDILNRWINTARSNTPELRVQATAAVAPRIARMDPDQILRQTQRVANRLHRDWNTVLHTIQKHMRPPASSQSEASEIEPGHSLRSDLRAAAALLHQAATTLEDQRTTVEENHILEYDGEPEPSCAERNRETEPDL